MLIHIKRNTEVFGPYSIEEAREYLSSGRLLLSDFAQLPGTAEWIPLGSVPGVRSAPPPPPPSSADLPGTAPVSTHQPLLSETATRGVSYAGFWIRFAASVIDSIILVPINFLLTYPSLSSSALWQGTHPATSQAELIGQEIGKQLVVIPLACLVSWAYISVLLSGPWQATLGMKACGLKITDESGNRISFGRATGRWFAMWLSGCPTLGIGFLMIAWTKKKQGLHDIIARTLVVQGSVRQNMNYDNPSAQNKHSRSGIASFVLSLAVAVLLLMLIVVAGVLQSQHGQSSDYPQEMAVGLVAMLLSCLAAVAAVLGIVSICQKAKKKLLGIVGLFVSSLSILCTVTLAIVGGIYNTRAPAAGNATQPNANASRQIAALQQAAERGDAGAQNSLGVMYQDGRGMAQDVVEAFKWYYLAAAQGNTNAARNRDNLAGALTPQQESESSWLISLAQIRNSESGASQADIDALIAAAEQGDGKAQIRLGWLYCSGSAVPQNYAEAVNWWRKAADQGLAEAQQNVGMMYYLGRGVPQSYDEAVKWFFKVAQQGEAVAQYSVGQAFEWGQGVPRDDVAAYTWYSLAAEQGYSVAVIHRDKLSSRLTPEQIADARKRADSYKARMFHF